VLDVESVRDPEQLRAVCRAYESSHRILTRRIEELAQKLAEYEGVDAAQAALDLPPVQVQIGSESSSQTEAGADLPSQAEPPATTAGPPRRGHGPREQSALPVVLVDRCYETSPPCPACQGEMDVWKGQTEDSEQITVRETTFRLEIVRRQKYRCRCNGAVVTAPGPPKLIPGGRYSLDFAVHSAVQKFCDHLPLERQSRMAARQGLQVTSQTLWDQQAALAGHLEPTWGALWDRALAEDVLHVDETSWRMMDPTLGSKWTLFGATSPDLAVYQLVGSKSAKQAREILSGFRGTLVVDGYAVYPIVAEMEKTIRIAHCWAHADRKFSDATDPPAAVARVRSLIHRLYEIERDVPGPFPGTPESQALRHRLRQEKSRPVLEELRAFAFDQGGLRRSAFGKALRYLLKHWDGLTVFVEEPRVPLDNNAAERALRGPVVGRKNFYGNRSKRGARVAAILYSLIETAKLQGLDPAQYLRTAATAAIEKPGTETLPF
jgi:transposase